VPDPQVPEFDHFAHFVHVSTLMTVSVDDWPRFRCLMRR
jgi:hypothetical protein